MIPKASSINSRNMWLKKPIFIFLLILSSLSFIRLFRFVWNSSLSATPPINPKACSISDPAILEDLPHPDPPAEDILSPKEHQLLSSIVSQRVPCNLLIFGFKTQFLPLATLNSKGTTVFLEDDQDKLRDGRLKGMRVHLFKNHENASRAYELLEHARRQPAACGPQAGSSSSSMDGSGCDLALRGLPKLLHRKRWDVMVIDGPSGDRAEAPGRMGAIYMAAVIARRVGRRADVLVHDTDRTIERWYSWEFLCHENLASAKGKLWHFRIQGNSSSDRFCDHAASLVQY